MKEPKSINAFIQYSKLLSLIPAFLSRELWTKKVFYRALIYLIFRILCILGGILSCLAILLGFQSRFLLFVPNLLMILFAWRSHRPDKFKFLVLLLFVGFLILELGDIT